ncbi:MAG: acyltransferase family protein [Solobacterium sp.]|nr:acyltransferase family protein [Solobacterium sp.]
MTKGMAILCMVVLHLFCRKGTDVYGTPLLWVSPGVPLAYWFGFYSEICVHIYSICAGYALYRGYTLFSERGRAYISSIHRLPRLLLNYWIVVCLFSVVGLLVRSQNNIPGSFNDFILNLFLIRSYNGAWWYLNTYILLVVLSPVLLYPIRKASAEFSVIGSLVISVIWYVLNRFNMIPAFPEQTILSFMFKEFQNLMSILPAVWIGAAICKGKFFDRINKKLKAEKNQSRILIVWILLFVVTNIIEKAVFVLPCAVLTFILFNFWIKPEWVKQVFLFLGKHSTNIWLSHMFFYLVLFKGLVQKALYPVFMLGFMMILCIATSYVVMAIEKRVLTLIQYYRNV